MDPKHKKHNRSVSEFKSLSVRSSLNRHGS